MIENRVIPVDGDLRPYFKAERIRRASFARAMRRYQLNLLKVHIQANVQPFMDAMRRAGDALEAFLYVTHPHLWAERYTNDLTESYGEVEDVFV